ncbi:MAG TPA: glycosyltransferase family 4 protein [Candidatus Acidoferrales bacterium]|nr:glycosyltransferase family 4 protein [Candidatus Acidoferrales bacterium]
MKILMTTDAVGGVWTYTVELARSLAKRNHEIAVATMGPPPTVSQRADIAAISGAMLYESTYKLEWMGNPWRDVEMSAEWLLDLDRSLRPDIVHLNGYVHGALPWSAPVLIVAHSCVLSWWLAVKGEPAPDRDWATYRIQVCDGIRAADCVIAPTAAMLQSLQRLYGPPQRSCVVPNGRNPSLFHAAPANDAFVAASGRLWDEAKNIGALDRVAGELDWPVLVVGQADPPMSHASSVHLRSCRLLGQFAPDAFAHFLARAQIFCAPARYEPFGLSVLEAALSNCALVLGDIQSLRESWDGAAMFVSPDNDRQLAAALNELIRNPALRHSLASKSMQRASGLTSDRMASSYARVYSTMVESEYSSQRVRSCA